ncbi:hypothetical protein HO173_005739 [Letharia columbiana]|uniref:Uncharacterized protein n=1 Tax=Letharia columbiana TaxID=112416 RepID=A0A8H6FWI3_9LECA|nr:uncharacterized protein HO173_005739 [Letharia columbiana]KAF6236111.1 hypothetical protein HO173_005739 [Letharia columbiana]
MAMSQGKGYGTEDGLDGKSMGDTGQIYSEAPRPGCQQVLEDDTCMRWIFFSSIDGLDGKSMGDIGQIYMEDYDKKTGQGEELGESCWHAGKIWPISPGSLQDNVGMAGMDGTVKTSMRSDVFGLLPLHLGKSSPVEAYTDYGCLET